MIAQHTARTQVCVLCWLILKTPFSETKILLWFSSLYNNLVRGFFYLAKGTYTPIQLRSLIGNISQLAWDTFFAGECYVLDQCITLQFFLYKKNMFIRPSGSKMGKILEHFMNMTTDQAQISGRLRHLWSNFWKWCFPMNKWVKRS